MERQRPFLGINSEVLRKSDPEIDRLLNQFAIPSIWSNLKDIFSDTGALFKTKSTTYRIRAIGYESAFVLRLFRYTKKRGAELDTGFSVLEVYNRMWHSNPKISIEIKNVLDHIHKKYVIPYEDHFKRVLSGKRKGHIAIVPLDFRSFRREYSRVKPYYMVNCPVMLDRKPLDHCMNQCIHFKEVKGLTVICTKITQIIL